MGSEKRKNSEQVQESKKHKPSQEEQETISTRGEKRKKHSKKEKSSKKEKKSKSKSKHSEKKVKTDHEPTLSAEEYREKREIFILKETENIPDPIQSFDKAGFDPIVLEAACKGFHAPTPVQAQCWPVALQGRDLVAIAETGSGKTYAFALPAIAHLQKQSTLHTGKPRVFVLAPTRELAIQTFDSFVTAGSAIGLRTLCLYGGVPKRQQKDELMQGADVIVGTVGRVLDFANEGTLDLSQVSYAVLDEADRMLDMGFEEDVKTLLGMCQRKRQTLMFSATWPRAIQELASRLMRNPLHIRIGRHNNEQNTDSLHANTKITQTIEVLSDPGMRIKETRLLELMKKYNAGSKNKVLVFALYKKEAARLEELLFKHGYNVVGVHGDKNQHDRSSALEEFKTGEKPIMVATDVAARGLDIPNVQVVLNVTFPLTIEDYVHRIGRTGRAGQTGMAHTFFTVHDKAHAGALAKVLKDAGQEVPEALGQFGFTSKKKEHKIYGAFYKEVDPSVKATHITFDDDE